MNRIACLILILFASNVWATVHDSDGTEASVQTIHDTLARDGDTIAIPAGVFTWNNGVTLTKGVTIAGRTQILNAGSYPDNCSSDDQTVIIDEKARPSPNGLVNFRPPAGKSIRLTGVTFKFGSSTTQHNDAIVTISTTSGLVNSARIDHCHFDHIIFEENILVNGWILGVTDHNLFDIGLQHICMVVREANWNGYYSNPYAGGHSSWADYPYYGSNKFWFVETNTIRGVGGISGSIDSSQGGRVAARKNFFLNAYPHGHGTEGWPQQGMRTFMIYDNIVKWDQPFSPQTIRGGSSITHDNTFYGTRYSSPTHAAMLYYREFNGIAPKIPGWGQADGATAWDVNDPHGEYSSGTTLSNTIISGGRATFPVEIPIEPNAYTGMMVRNDNPLSSSNQHSSFIISNTSTTITYWYQASQAKPPLVFNQGDAFSIRKVLIGVGQPGRGKGDLVNTNNPPTSPSQQQETCFSWNNKNIDLNLELGIGNAANPNMREGSDYVNLGAGFPRDQIPAQVTAAYPAEVNGGLAYDHEFVYPHPLVVQESPSPTPTASPSATATAAPTNTPTPSATATPTATSTATATLTPTPTATETPTAMPTATASATFTPTPTPTQTEPPSPTPTATATATATEAPSPTPEGPQAPSELTANGMASSQMDLRWTNNDPRSDGIYIERCAGGCGNSNNFAIINIVSPSCTRLSDFQLGQRKNYWYRARVHTPSGYSGYSNVAQGRTQ